ncbi:MAG TPA: nucleotidyltransferase domain-containing protein [Nitrospirae bacterium]|nr:nucleotidyltransferase domain-containing protein [Nitrospirota bacterium]
MMALMEIFEERERERKRHQEDALREVYRLAALLKERFDFESLYVVGSLLKDRFRKGSDIDLVIKGLKKEDFFRAHAFLMDKSRYRIDLKPFEDLHEDFKKLVLKGGLKIE